MDTLLYLFACYGLTFALCDATILSGPRRLFRRVAFFREMLECYFCTGFWASAVVFAAWAYSNGFLVDASSPWHTAAYVLVNALAGAAFTYGLNVALTYLERHTPEVWVVGEKVDDA